MGGVLGFIAGIVMTPVVILFGHTVDIIERKLRPSRKTSVSSESKKPDESIKADNIR